MIQLKTANLYSANDYAAENNNSRANWFISLPKLSCNWATPVTIQLKCYWRRVDISNIIIFHSHICVFFYFLYGNLIQQIQRTCLNTKLLYTHTHLSFGYKRFAKLVLVEYTHRVRHIYIVNKLIVLCFGCVRFERFIVYEWENMQQVKNKNLLSNSPCWIRSV